jgi:hypothetical protein
MPAYHVNGVLVTGHLHVVISAASTQTLKGTLAGVKVTIVCEEAHGLGTVNNLHAMGESLGTLHYLKCTVTAPANQFCLVHNELVITEPTKNLLLLLPATGGYRVDFSPETGTIYTTIIIDNCTTSALNGSFPVEGSAGAEAKSSSSILEFTATSSELTFGGNAATYTGKLHVLTLGGEPVLIENGNLP